LISVRIVGIIPIYAYIDVSYPSYSNLIYFFNLFTAIIDQCPMLENDHKGITGAIPTEIGSVPLMVVDMGM